MPVLTVLIPTRNRARCLERALESLLVSAELAGPDVAIAVFDNHSGDDTEPVCRNLMSRHPRLSYQRHVELASSAEQSAYFALRALADAQRTEFFWIFGDDDVALPEACSDILRALQDGHDFVLAGLEVSVTDPPTGMASRIAYYDLPARYAHYDQAGDLFRDFGVVTATTTLSCLAGRLAGLDLPAWSQLLDVSAIYSHSLAMLLSYARRPAAVLGGVQIVYSANSVDNELDRLRASGLLSNRGSYWPYSEGLLLLLELAGTRLSADGWSWQDVEEIHLSKHTWRLVHGTLLGFLFDMYVAQARLAVDSHDPAECPDADSVQRLRRFVQRHASGRQRDVGLGLCEVMDGLQLDSPEDRDSVAAAQRGMQALDVLEISSRLERGASRTLRLSQGRSSPKGLRAEPVGKLPGEVACLA